MDPDTLVEVWRTSDLPSVSPDHVLGDVIVVSARDDRRRWVVDATSGEVLWALSGSLVLPGQVSSTMAPALLITVSSAGDVGARDRRTGQTRWWTDGPEDSDTATIHVLDGWMVVGDRDSFRVLRIDTGEVVRTMPGPVPNIVAHLDEDVLVTAEIVREGDDVLNLAAVATMTGEARWTATVPLGQLPEVIDGAVVITRGGNLESIDVATGITRWSRPLTDTSLTGRIPVRPRGSDDPRRGWISVGGPVGSDIPGLGRVEYLDPITGKVVGVRCDGVGFSGQPSRGSFLTPFGGEHLNDSVRTSRSRFRAQVVGDDIGTFGTDVRLVDPTGTRADVVIAAAPGGLLLDHDPPVLLADGLVALIEVPDRPTVERPSDCSAKTPPASYVVHGASITNHDRDAQDHDHRSRGRSGDPRSRGTTP